MANDRGDRVENQIGRGASAVTGPDFGVYIGDINNLPRLSNSGHEANLGNLTIAMGPEASVGQSAVSRAIGSSAPEVIPRDPYHIDTDPYEGTNDADDPEHHHHTHGFPT